MPKLVVVLILLFVVASVSWYFGYISGAENQIYFDAVAKASLYEKAISLNDENTRLMLKGFLLKQQCILSSEFNYSNYTVNHPIHSDVLEYYHANIDRICGASGCGCEYIKGE